MAVSTADVILLSLQVVKNTAKLNPHLTRGDDGGLVLSRIHGISADRLRELCTCSLRGTSLIIFPLMAHELNTPLFWSLNRTCFGCVHSQSHWPQRPHR